MSVSPAGRHAVIPIQVPASGVRGGRADSVLMLRVLAYARISEAQAVALLDNLINGLVQERARAAALQLKLDFLPGFGLLPRLGLGLSFQPHPRGVFIA